MASPSSLQLDVQGGTAKILWLFVLFSGPCQRSGQQVERGSGTAQEDQGSPWSQALLGVRFDFLPAWVKTACKCTDLRVWQMFMKLKSVHAF